MLFSPDRMHPILSRNEERSRHEVEHCEATDKAFIARVVVNQSVERCSGLKQAIGHGGSSIDQLRRSGLLCTGRIAKR